MDEETKALARAWINKSDQRPFSLEDFCFGKQLNFVKDQSPYATAICSRRAGKTVGCAADLIHTALGREGIVCLYITLNRLSAKRIIWPDLLKICRDYNLEAKINESELSITFKNGSRIYVSGAKDKTEIEKFRGLGLALVYVDECGSFKSYIQELIDDIIAKALFDYGGRLRLIGTPGPVPVGYFFECSQSAQWSHHHWTMFDNPWLPIKSGMSHEDILQRELDRKGVSRQDPSIQRECFGQWAFDPNALVFRYNSQLNDYQELPRIKGEWSYVIGVDIGFTDADAICVIGWNEETKEAYLIEELVTHKQGITELANQLEIFIKKYNPLRVVMDTGGLGQKIAEEIRKRYALPISPAEKARKFEYIEILNDALRTRRFFAKKSSCFSQDCALVEWDRDNLTPDGKPKIKDTFHSDICDAVLYAYREALNWLYEAPKPQIRPYTQEWYKKEQDEMYQQAWERARKQEDDEENYYSSDF